MVSISQISVMVNLVKVGQHLYFYWYLPGVLSYIYKEKMLGDTNTDICDESRSRLAIFIRLVYVSNDVNTASGSDITIKASDVGSYFNDAFKCQFGGINDEGDDC